MRGQDRASRRADHRRILACLVLMVLSALRWVGEAQAQAPPTPGTAPRLPGVIPPLTSPIPGVLPPEQPEIVPPSRPPAEAAPPPPAGPPVRVDEIRVDGVTVYNEAELRSLYSDAIGPAVPRARLDEIVQDLQRRYREDGYILTVVRGEFQRVGGRVVFVIRAIEGYIGSVKLDGDIGPAGTLVYGLSAKPDDKAARQQRRSRALSAPRRRHTRGHGSRRAAAPGRARQALSSWSRRSRASR